MPRERRQVDNPYRSAVPRRSSERVCGMNPGVFLMMALLTVVLCVRLHDSMNPHGAVLGNISGMRQHPGVPDGSGNDDGIAQYNTRRHASRRSAHRTKGGNILSHATLDKIDRYRAAADEEEERTHREGEKIKHIAEEVDKVESYAAVKQRHAAHLAARKHEKAIAETWGLEEVKPQAHHDAEAKKRAANGTALRADVVKLANALGTFYRSIHVEKSPSQLSAIAKEWHRKPEKLHAALVARYKKAPFIIEEVLFHERKL